MKKTKDKVKYKIKKGDLLAIIVGKDSGKSGKADKILPKSGKVIIAGMNVQKKHAKPSSKLPKGGILEIAAPINISNVMLLCPKCNKKTRVGYKIIKQNDSKKKVRICKKCGEEI